ncbi:polysaccharide export protein [Ancylobacter sp. 6x-1]|uniref:Polysaccharide export protein n=1 Tax=Ancylobacter crimeensis TaxID=2579147 RepID=A0ABT0D6N0_9HYPH|nr:polysaccharide biosynthesis/export family protein [Ancylobacter crimeensis]MCK0195592.1 polysaccharide export protein [Ancylobacter crimeensis]
MRLLAIFGLIALLISGCAGAQGPGAGQASGSRATSYAEARTPAVIPASLANEATSSIDSNLSEYRLGGYDLVTVSVLGVPELTGDFQVGPDGTMSLPLLGQVHVAGLTPQQLQVKLATELGRKYLQSPQVSVSVKEYRSQRVTVEGAVNKPGVFTLNNSTTLIQAVAMAEGTTRYAELQNTLVFRTTNGQKSVARFDLDQVRAGKAADPVMKAGDVVVITESQTKSALRDILMALPIASLFVAIF